MTPSLEEAHRFLALARADFAAFRVLASNAGIRPAIALFHAQQAVEKSLKALLFAQGVEFRRTHDLFELADKLQACGVALPSRVESVGKLNPYAVSFRYDSHDADLMSLEQADQIAQDVLHWAAVTVTAIATKP